MNKKIILFAILPVILIIAAAFTVTNTSLPEKIMAHYAHKYMVFDVEASDWKKLGLTEPKGDLPVDKILEDSFLTSSNTIIYLHVKKFFDAASIYNHSHVQTGYGFMPQSPYGSEKMSIYWFNEEAKKLLNKTLFGSKIGRQAMYKKAIPTFVSVFVQKPDSLQAVDLFLIWKGLQYCNYIITSGLEKEKGRSLKENFTNTDWRERTDYDAKIYAFVYRRISEGTEFRIENARYYGEKIFTDFFASASPSAKTIFENWKAQWQKNQITTTPHFKVN